MTTGAIRQLTDVMLERRPTVPQLQNALGCGDARYQPPNQVALEMCSGAVDRAEVTLVADHPDAVPKKVTLILRSQAGASVAELQALFGAWDVVDEDRRPAPAALVVFADIRAPSRGIDLLVMARVTRPVGPGSEVRSVQVVRSTYMPTR